MDPVWDALNKACDKNEAQLKELEEISNRLPREPRSWFYLKSDLLCPPSSILDSDARMQSRTDEKSFVSVFIENKESVSNQCVTSIALGEKLEEDDITHVSQVTKLQEKSLKEVLSDPNFPEATMKFIKFKGPESSESLNESDTVAFCCYLLEPKTHLGELAGSHLFNFILYPVICNVQKMFLSVMLLEKVRQLANKFPVFMMNGVIIPVISRDDLEKQALDIVCDILDGMTEDSLHCTLKSFLTSLKRNDENAVKLLATIFKKKPKLDNEMAFLLVAKLQNLSGQFSSSIQFGKLLHEIMPLLNLKVSESSLKILKDVLDHHTTFLKTTVLKLFNNLTHT